MFTSIHNLPTGLGSLPSPDKCDPGYYEPISSGKIIVENGEEIYGALRIDRAAIRSFDTVGHVGNSDGARVFELLDGRRFILIDRYNSLNYVIGYEVVPCKNKCFPCPTSCRTVQTRTVYYARPTRTSPTDVEIKVSRKKITCSTDSTIPKVDCAQ